MNLQIIKKCPISKPSAKQIRLWHKKVSHTLKKLKKWQNAHEVTLVLVAALEGKKLNRKFRNKNYATDVLSFAPTEAGSLGEIVICIPIIKKQARAHGLRVEDEFLYMYIHGLLHLLGYEHEKNDKQARRMYRLQDQLFEDLRG
jgi:probable rRNA maturation factor